MKPDAFQATSAFEFTQMGITALSDLSNDNDKCKIVLEPDQPLGPGGAEENGYFVGFEYSFRVSTNVEGGLGLLWNFGYEVLPEERGVNDGQIVATNEPSCHPELSAVAPSTNPCTAGDNKVTTSIVKWTPLALVTNDPSSSMTDNVIARALCGKGGIMYRSAEVCYKKNKKSTLLHVF